MHSRTSRIVWIALAGSVFSLQAAPILTKITANNGGVILNAIPVAGSPGTGESGYILFGAIATNPVPSYGYVTALPGVANLPNSATVSVSGTCWRDALCTVLAVDGEDCKTAQLQKTAVITLQGAIPRKFRLGVLMCNGKDASWDLTVSSPSVSPTASVTIQSRYQTTKVNRFFCVDVEDAVAGDTIKVYNGERFGGIAFDMLVPPTASSTGTVVLLY